jgi:ribose transport system ATP-binding protein
LKEYALEMIDISKSFPGVKALDSVSFRVKKGEVHALVGENGAGKSTLVKVLDGVYTADSGKIRIDGKEVVIKDTNHSKELGIGLIFQEFNLISSLSVSENIYLARLKNNKAGLVDWKKTNMQAEDLLESLNFTINPNAIVEELSVASKQLVEIAKALSFDAQIIIMDEPTSSLTENEIEKLFLIIRDLKEKGITVIYISHRLEEIFSIADTVTVMRDGKNISTKAIEEETKNQIIEKMVGRALDIEFPKRKSHIREAILEIDVLNTKAIEDISFQLHAGEILGISGLVGSGRTELAKAIFGEDPVRSGTIKIKGKTVKIRSAGHAKKYGIALIPEDRKEEGLVLNFSVMWNTTICNLTKIINRIGILSRVQEKKRSQDIVKKLGVKTPSLNQKTIFLSGGNQQKVVVAKWLFSEPDILIMDEPTRGIDVGAKYEIYQLMNAMVSEGKAIIMISSELPEVMAMSDRILVMNKGRIKGVFERDEINAKDIIKAAIS